MKFDTHERMHRPVPAETRTEGTPELLPRHASRTAQHKTPAWLQEGFSLLFILGGLCFLFFLWRAAAFVIRIAAGSPN
jgi:hypothetical protein